MDFTNVYIKLCAEISTQLLAANEDEKNEKEEKEEQKKEQQQQQQQHPYMHRLEIALKQAMDRIFFWPPLFANKESGDVDSVPLPSDSDDDRWKKQEKLYFLQIPKLPLFKAAKQCFHPYLMDTKASDGTKNINDTNNGNTTTITT
ncbi:hypothetical protein RFI_17159, partial [Reticulomyxa filosa]